VRVAGADTAVKGRAIVFPRARVSVRTVGRNRIRITHTLRAPAGVPVRGRSRFYLGRVRARSARYVESARARRASSRRYVARVTVRVPARYRGRFSYAACFRAAAGSGMGDPGRRCPSRSFRP
jgi:hypothetical protein